MENLSELISIFLDSRRYLSRRSVEYYQDCLGGLLWYSRKKGWPPPDKLTRSHLTDFLGYVATEKHRWGDGRRASLKQAAAATVYHYGKVVRFFFSWAKEEEYLPKNPAARLELPRPHYRQVEPYSNEEVKAMLEVCEHDIANSNRYLGIRNCAIISLFIDTGLRLSELAGIGLSDLDPNLHQLRVMGKGAKLRVVPINGLARKALKRYLTQARQPGGDPLWKTDGGAALSSYSIRIMVNRLKTRAGVKSGGGCHRFRHYFATHCLDNGMELNTLRLLLGHATLNMVIHYTQFVDVKKALIRHQQCSPLDGLYQGNSRKDGWGWRGK